MRIWPFVVGAPVISISVLAYLGRHKIRMLWEAYKTIKDVMKTMDTDPAKPPSASTR